MQMRVTYLPVNYKTEAQSSLVSRTLFDAKAQLKTHDVDIPLYDKHLNEMGAQDWELISIQPLPNIEFTPKRDISVTGGFYLFWQRRVTTDEQPERPMSSHEPFPAPSSTSAFNTREKTKSTTFNDIVSPPTGIIDTTVINENPITNNDLKNRIDAIKEMLRGNSNDTQDKNLNVNSAEKTKSITDNDYQDLEGDILEEDVIPDNKLILPLNKD